MPAQATPEEKLMRLILRWWTMRIGRRGAILALLGLIWLAYGIGQFVEPPPPASKLGLSFLLLILPYQYWASLWIVAALAAFTAVLRVHRDHYAFVALGVPPLLWTTAYFVSWWPMNVFDRGWIAALVWASMASVIAVVSGWDEPRRWR